MVCLARAIASLALFKIALAHPARSPHRLFKIASLEPLQALSRGHNDVEANSPENSKGRDTFEHIEQSTHDNDQMMKSLRRELDKVKNAMKGKIALNLDALELLPPPTALEAPPPPALLGTHSWWLLHLFYLCLVILTAFFSDHYEFSLMTESLYYTPLQSQSQYSVPQMESVQSVQESPNN
nr:hypothetical protein CFP56_15806 [Quercus suber]